MKTKLTKIIGSTVLFIAFLFLAYGSGEEKNQNEKWKKNSIDCFCGKEFKWTKNIDQIDMDIKSVTVFNCDGTYTSKQNWGTSKENEEVYNNTAGRSSGDNYSFSGKWEIVNENIPTEIENYFSTGGFKLDDYTIIIYKSDSGKIRYAYIHHDGKDTKLYLGLVVLRTESVPEDGYEDKDYDLFSGFID
jgi:hypothetical protein